MAMRHATSEIRETIEATLWLDTHEHLVAEATRIHEKEHRFRSTLGAELAIPADWTALLVDYSVRDLVTAGMSPAHVPALFGAELDAVEKWDLVAPFLEAARLTGYLRAVDLTTERLFGARLNRDTCTEIDRLARSLRQPGFYRDVLRRHAKVERCHIHSMEVDPFRASDSPDLIDHDLSIVPLVLGRHDRAESLSGVDVRTLGDYIEVIDWCFQEYGSQAVAVKCLWAYLRSLRVEEPAEPPRRAFEHVRRGTADAGEQRSVEDYLFGVCLERARQCGLPVKLHMGYLDDLGRVQLPSVYDHVRDVVPVLQAHPETRFVLMHMAWPQQEQLIAVAKHHPNAVVDLCWAWILAPLSTRDFVQRFLTTVPATKLMCFGGDYFVAENVVGHAEMARRGLEAALCGLVENGWMRAREGAEVVPLLMYENARSLFGEGGERRCQ